MNISLKKIDKSNWEDCIELKVGPTQTGHILPNVNSLAEWSVTPEAQAYGIFNNDEMVGFVMLQKDSGGIYDIHRFMIDFEHQRKGYGKSAMELVVKLIKSLPDAGEKIKIMFLVENSGAEKLYLACGFVDSGRTEHNSKWRFTEKVFYYHFQ